MSSLALTLRCLQTNTTKIVDLTDDAQTDSVRSTCDSRIPTALLYVIPTPGEDEMDFPFYVLFTFNGVSSSLLKWCMLLESPWFHSHVVDPLARPCLGVCVVKMQQ